jgi:hypothetical protein
MIDDDVGGVFIDEVEWKSEKKRKYILHKINKRMFRNESSAISI